MKPRGDILVLVAAATCFGAAVLPAQWAADAGLTAAAAVAIRFVVATATVLPFVTRQAQDLCDDHALPPPRREVASPALAGRKCMIVAKILSLPRHERGWGLYLAGWLISGGVNTAGFILLTEALSRTTAATAAFLSSLSVVVVPLLVAAATRRLPGAGRLVAVGLAVVGSLVLTGGGVSFDAGAGLALATAFVGSLHVLSVSWFAPRLDVAKYNAGQLAVTAVGAGVVVAAGPGLGAVTLAGLGAAAFCGLAQAAGLTFQARGQQKVDGSTAALIFTLVPVVALLSAWALDAQIPSAAELVGGALLIAAVVVGERLATRARPDPGNPGALGRPHGSEIPAIEPGAA